MTTAVETTMPAPGFHPRIPADQYHGWEAASKSRLWVMASPRTPAHLRYRLDSRQVESDCLRLGDAAHAVILEPERFAAEYVTAGQCAAELLKGGRCSRGGVNLTDGRWYCQQHTDPEDPVDTTKAVVSADELAMLKAMRKSVAAHPKASALITAKGWTELSLLWKDRDEDALCKCRIDRYVSFEGQDVAVDIKTTRDASPDGFRREMFNHGYHVQAAIYLAGLSNTVGRLHTRFIFIAIDKAPPYPVAVYELDNGALIQGWDTYQKLLHTYAECQRTGNWPGYADDVQTLSLPEWVRTEEESE